MGVKNTKMDWNEVFEKDLEAFKEISKKSFNTLVQKKDHMQEAQKELPAQVKADWAEFNKHNHTVFEEMFNKYDADGNGILDQKECELLTKEALLQQKKFVPKLVKGLMTAELNGIFNIASAQGQKFEESDREHYMKLLEESLKPMVKHVQSYVDECISKHTEISDMLWKLMDTNSDGKVTKEEFVENFLKFSKITLFNGAELQRKCHEIFDPTDQMC